MNRFIEALSYFLGRKHASMKTVIMRIVSTLCSLNFRGRAEQEEGKRGNVRPPRVVNNNIWVSIKSHTTGAVMTVIGSKRGKLI